MAGDEEKSIRVVDRRMFTPEGELRSDFQPDETLETPVTTPEAAAAPAPPTPPSPPESAPGIPTEAGPEEAAAGEPPPEDPKEPRSDFASLVRSLASTAYSALGLIPDPAGSRRRDVAIARQMIDWLAMLEQKTRGNVSFEESDFLARILYELRLAYVEVTRPPAR